MKIRPKKVVLFPAGSNFLYLSPALMVECVSEEKQTDKAKKTKQNKNTKKQKKLKNISGKSIEK